MIDDAQGDGEGTGAIPFRLWPAQVGVVWQMMLTKMLVILKARQLGISWLCVGYVLWLCLFHNGKLALLFSQGELEAKELLRRVKAMYDRLPEWLKELHPLESNPSTSEIAWANGSRCRSLPATEKAGRSFTASLVVMDEAAWMQWGGGLYTAVKPTIDAGGQLIVLSTANGVGNWFHWIWKRAESGLTRFKAVFLPWWSRPGRDQAWYADQVAEESEPGKVKQEYPANPTEAFLASGNTRFRPEWIDAQAPNVRDSLPRSQWPPSLRHLDDLQLFAPPIQGRTYIVSADVAEGLEHGDASDAVVLDSVTWEEVASLNVRCEPDEFAAMLFALSEAYDAEIVVERNNHGHAVISKLNSLGSTRIAYGLDNRPGWLTNVQTKPQVIDLIAQALRDGVIVIRTQQALDELKEYQRLPGGKTGAPSGKHDDRVMSRAIGIGYLVMAGPKNVEWGANPLDGIRW